MRIRTAAAALSAVAALSGLTVVTAAPASAAPKPVEVQLQLLAFNDFHGALQPPGGSGGRVTLEDGSSVDAGGLAYFAAHLKALEEENKNTLTSS